MLVVALRGLARRGVADWLEVGGCACGGLWIGGGCLGCGVDYGTCWQRDPASGQWIYVCY